MCRFHLFSVLLAGAFAAAAGQAQPTLAEDFRVDNAVYSGDEKEPTNRSTTIFREGVVYDCLTNPAETVVFDKAAGRFVLLNVMHRKRSELTTTEVTAVIDRLQSVAAKSKDPLVKFLAEPKFQERVDDAAGELTLTSPLVSYRLVLSHEPSPDLVGQYHEFCDWYARLNSLLVPGSRPPFGRLMVNAALAQRQATASQVVLTVTSGKGQKPSRTTIRSEHKVVRPLGPADLDRVTQIRECLGSFNLVSFEEYRKLEPR